jgi:general L-amino acid transport system permease protein
MNSPHDNIDPKTPSEIASHVEEPTQADLRIHRRNAFAALGWARENLFSSTPNTLLTLVSVGLLAWFLPPLLDWMLLKATFLGDDPQACKDAGGACWSFVTVKHRFILFGLYPYDEQWRPLLAMAIFIAALAASCDSRFWNKRILLIWGVVLPFCGLLMWGGAFGLSFVPNDKWGGLPLTLILATLGIVLAFPLSVLLALGRRSDMPAIRAICVGYIETVRGVPLVSVLFMASIMFPLFLPEGITIDKLLRAQLGIMLFTAAYLAEAVRGGLQALPKGQYEAADALGLSYWQKTRLIILPQALRLVIPPIVNQFISCFKDTSLVIIIGLYDLLTTAKTALSDPSWRAFYIESYVFAALIYFLFCFFMSRYSQYLERRLNTGLKR